MKNSIGFRAFLALIMMVGFYLLGLAIMGILLYIPYAEWTFAGRLHLKLAAFCILGAITILIAILPRRDKFIQPGPLLRESEQPALFNEIKRVAELTGQEMPEEVYLMTDVNAWVSEYGGFLGSGSKRIMGIGLTLLRTVSVSELRAILVHEFGHYYGGDTKLSPWVYRTRTAIERTLRGLSEQSSLLQKPFLLYGKLFLKVTHAVSRVQELTADRLAAQIAGADHFAGGLKKISAVAPAFDAYWREELAPVLSSGFLPPISDGFRMFIQSENIEKALDERLQEQLEYFEINPYDTHPSLKRRVENVRDISGNRFEQQNTSEGISLLEQVPELEKQLLTYIADKNAVEALKPIDWEETAEKIYLPFWKSLLEKYSSELEDVTPVNLPEIAKDVTLLASKIKQREEDRGRAPEELANQMIGAAISCMLYEKGWAVTAPPGAPVKFRNGDVEVEPFALLNELASGKLQASEWRDICDSAGIRDINLSKI